MNKSTCLMISFAILLGLASFSPSMAARAHTPPTNTVTSTPIANQDYIRNGGFDQGKTAWKIVGISSGVFNHGPDGSPALVMEGITESRVDAYQEIYLPSQTTSAVLAFDYRLLYPDFPVAGTTAGFYAQISTYSVTLATALAAPFAGDTGWQHLDFSLGATEISQLQTAHADGEPVYILFVLYQEPSNVFKAYVDNVSFKVTGSMDYPTPKGSIAYIGMDDSGYAKTVNRIGPDGNGPQTLWTYPASSGLSHIYDAAWKPNAAELAFSSNHEEAYSAFTSDVYGVKPDGSGVRRITNPPSKAELDGGGYSMGSVTGKIRNNYGSVALFLVYIEGAQEALALDVGAFGDEVGFSIPNVADLGVGLHYVVFTWSKPSVDCANGKEYAAAVVDVQAGQTVDAGTLTFSGQCGKYNSSSISWKRDGSEVGVDVITPRTFLAAGQAIGRDLFNAPLSADKLAWSPLDDQLLYHQSLGDYKGIYLTTVGSNAGDSLVNTAGALWVTPAWLPDGSGFIYTADSAIYQYILAGKQNTLLATFFNEYVANPSPSSDGNYVVFERQSTGVPLQYDLWIINRSHPVEMWPLTHNGKSANPDWSRVNPPDANCSALAGVSISGATAGYTNTTYAFTAATQPATASLPISYTWSPAPDSGQGTAKANYTWMTTVTQTISLTATNCGGTVNGSHTISISAPGIRRYIYLPLVVRDKAAL